MSNKKYLPPDNWISTDDVLKIVKGEKWTWALNSRCKYIELRIDTRDMKCLIFDRDKKPITLKDLSRQGDIYIDVK